MTALLTLVGLLTSLAAVQGHSNIRGPYRLYRLLDVLPKTLDDVAFLHRFAEQNSPHVELWNTGYGANGQLLPIMQLQVSPMQLGPLLQTLEQRGLAYDVVSTDLQKILDEEKFRNDLNVYTSENWHDRYHSYDEIMTYMDELLSKCGQRCTTMDIGDSYEGRQLKVIKISGTGEGGKPAVWIDAGIHAREWIAPATAQYLMDRLVNDYDADEQTKRMVDDYDWFILPCVNPDGYVYTWTEDRIWRKTRKPGNSSECVGADANRNFDFHWASVGTSMDPCSNIYPGQEAFSEPEARAMADFILQNNGTWTMYLTLHSKGQLILAPWGYTDQLPADYADLERVGVAMQKAIYDTHGAEYTFGTSAEILYKSSGTSRDWAKGVPKIKYVYTIELRDKGEHGWLLPPEQILPTGQEIWQGVRAAYDTFSASSSGSSSSSSGSS